MSAARKQRLEARLANLGTSAVPGTVRRHVSHWPLYAAVTGSALAMSSTTPAPGAHIQIPDITTFRHPSSSPNTPLIDAVRMAMARRDSRPAFEAATTAVSMSVPSGPAINPGGVVPADGTAN